MEDPVVEVLLDTELIRSYTVLPAYEALLRDLSADLGKSAEQFQVMVSASGQVVRRSEDLVGLPSPLLLSVELIAGFCCYCQQAVLVGASLCGHCESEDWDMWLEQKYGEEVRTAIEETKSKLAPAFSFGPNTQQLPPQKTQKEGVFETAKEASEGSEELNARDLEDSRPDSKRDFPQDNSEPVEGQKGYELKNILARESVGSVDYRSGDLRHSECPAQTRMAHNRHLCKICQGQMPIRKCQTRLSCLRCAGECLIAAGGCCSSSSARCRRGASAAAGRSTVTSDSSAGLTCSPCRSATSCRLSNCAPPRGDPVSSVVCTDCLRLQRGCGSVAIVGRSIRGIWKRARSVRCGGRWRDTRTAGISSASCSGASLTQSLHLPEIAVVFDIGQTISNQPNKEGMQERNKVYYRFIYDSLVALNYSKHFQSFNGYAKAQFTEDLNASVVARKKLKDERVDMLIEYTLSQHVLEVLLEREGASDRVEEFSHLVPELTDITSNTEQISKATYELWPDTISTLQELRANGYKIAVASNGAHAAKHEMLLEELKVRQYVDELAISSYLGVRKPNPEMLLIIAKRLGMTKDEIVVVGDMLDRDVLMGNAAGVRSIWINTLSYNPAQNLKRIRENNPLYRPTVGIVALSQLLPTIKYLDQGPAPDQLQVGYYFPSVKKKLDMGMQRALVPTRKVNFFPVELMAPLEFQSRIDILIHKATDLHLSKDPEMQRAMQEIEQYHRSHKEVLILDSVQALYTTTRRDKFEYILDFNEEDGAVRIPVTYSKDHITHFPVIIKTTIACQVRNSHKMVTVKNEEGLAPALAQFGEEEVIIQEMVRHNGLVYKIFVLGNDHFATRRESLAEPRADFEVYDSSELSENPSDQDVPWELNNEIVERVNRRVQAASSMTMFGYDVIVEAGTGSHVIVDLNYFPSYHGFPDFPQKLEEHVIRMAARHRSSLLPQADPGF